MTNHIFRDIRDKGEEVKPYYQDEWVTIYHGDCREILPELPKVDLVLTDPPYGKKSSRGTGGFGLSKNRRYIDDWDNTIPSPDIFSLMLRLATNVIIFGGNYFAHLLPASNCWLVWDKKGDISFKNPFADCELIYTTFNKPIKKYVFKQQGFIKDSKDEIYHPTQKPTELLIRILQDWGNDNDLILDPFLGSGTTAVCAKKLNRHCIGIEIEEKYCEIAAKRCSQSVFKLEV